MNSAIPPIPATGPIVWATTFSRRGFAQQGGLWRRNQLTGHVVDGWVVLTAANPEEHEVKAGSTRDQFGLWKLAGGPGQKWAFEFPANVGYSEFESDEGPPAEDVSPGAMLDWALASLEGELPPYWSPPAKQMVDSWLPADALTIRAGCLVRQGELLLAPNRWVLRAPLLPFVPAKLAPDRRVALELLATDAQNRIRMVRSGWDAVPDGSALVVTVDLTGAPHSPDLFSAAFDALCCTVTSLSETADLLGDPSEPLQFPLSTR